MVILRPYQQHAIGALQAALADQGHAPRVVLVAPTGSGKTSIAADLIRRYVADGMRALFVAHRRELVDQAAARLATLGIACGVMRGDDSRVAPEAPVQVASIQTLIRRTPPPAELVIIDEAHHASDGSQYLAMLRAYPSADVVGLTATPWRLDGKGLDGVFRDLVVVAQAADLVPEYLLEPRIFAPHVPDLRGVRRRGGDYDSGQIVERMGSRKVVGDVVEHWQRLAGGVRTLVFGATVEHSVMLRDAFLAAGVTAEHLDAKTPATERASVLGALKRGDVPVVCNVGILTEGYDLPELGCVSLVRPTQSSVLFLQQVGRVMRPLPGKPRPIILDHAGCCIEHGHPLDRIEYSLAGMVDARGRKREGSGVRICAECLGVTSASSRACAECGAQIVTTTTMRDLRPRAGSLTEVEREEREARRARRLERTPAGDRQAMLRHFQAEARRRGYRPGWAAYKYRSLYGVWPGR